MNLECQSATKSTDLKHLPGAERAGEPVPVEGHHGQDPAGGAPHPHLPPGASTRAGRSLSHLVWRRATAPHLSLFRFNYEWPTEEGQPAMMAGVAAHLAGSPRAVTGAHHARH